MSNLDVALRWANEGYRVFPCTSDKEPVGKWKDTATTDPGEIWDTFSEAPGLWVGMVVPEDMVVIDIDTKHGDGVAEWNSLCHGKVHGPQETMTVETPSGGFHIYYVTYTPLKTGQAHLGRNIDTRACGTGYVIAPGTPGYEIVADFEPAYVPEFVEKLPDLQLGAKTERNTKWDMEADDDVGAANALAERLPPFEDGKRDSQLASAAGSFYSKGFHPDTVVEALAEKLEEDGWGSKGWDDIERVVYSVYGNAKDTFGATAGDEPAEVDLLALAGTGAGASPPPPSRFQRLFYEDLEARAPVEWLVEDFIPQRAMGVLYGAYGSMKTFCALDLAMSIATGQGKWGDREARTGKVLIAAGEGADGLHHRLKAWYAEHEVEPTNDVALVPCVPVGRFDELVEFVKEGPDFVPDLLVIDTLSYATLGLEENSASEIMTMVSAYRDVIHTAWPECTVLFIGHKSKEGQSLRGSVALPAAMEFMIELHPDDGGTLVLETTKQKDGAQEGEKMAMRAREVVVGQYQNGKDRTTLILDHIPVPHEPRTHGVDLNALAKPVSWSTMTDRAKAVASVVNQCRLIERGQELTWAEMTAAVKVELCVIAEETEGSMEGKRGTLYRQKIQKALYNAFCNPDTTTQSVVGALAEQVGEGPTGLLFSKAPEDFTINLPMHHSMVTIE